MGAALSDVERGQVDTLITEGFASQDGRQFVITPGMATICAGLISNLTARVSPVPGYDSGSESVTNGASGGGRD